MDLAQCQGAHAAEFLRLAMELSMIRIVRNAPTLDAPQDRSWSEAEGLGPGRNVCPPILGCVQFSAGETVGIRTYIPAHWSRMYVRCVLNHMRMLSANSDMVGQRQG